MQKKLAKDRIMYLFSFPIVPYRFKPTNIHRYISKQNEKKSVMPIEKLMDYKANKSLVRISKTTKHVYERKKYARSNRFHDVQKQKFHCKPLSKKLFVA